MATEQDPLSWLQLDPGVEEAAAAWRNRTPEEVAAREAWEKAVETRGYLYSVNDYRQLTAEESAQWDAAERIIRDYESRNT